MIDLRCGSCGKKYRVKDEYAGRSTKCKACGSPMRVPAPERAVPSLPEAERRAVPVNRWIHITRALMGVSLAIIVGALLNLSVYIEWLGDKRSQQTVARLKPRLSEDLRAFDNPNLVADPSYYVFNLREINPDGYWVRGIYVTVNGEPIPVPDSSWVAANELPLGHDMDGSPSIGDVGVAIDLGRIPELRQYYGGPIELSIEADLEMRYRTHVGGLHPTYEITYGNKTARKTFNMYLVDDQATEDMYDSFVSRRRQVDSREDWQEPTLLWAPAMLVGVLCFGGAWFAELRSPDNSPGCFTLVACFFWVLFIFMNALAFVLYYSSLESFKDGAGWAG